jgi:plastocyanin
MPRRLLILLASLGLLLVATIASAPAVMGGGGCHQKEEGNASSGAGPVDDGATVLVQMALCDFAPTIAEVPVGTTVRFVNTDLAPHQVTGHRSSWSSELLEQGESYAWTFDAAGLYPYSCPLHPGMVGAIMVGGDADAPAAVVDDGTGTGTGGAATSAATGSDTAGSGGGLEPLAAIGLGAVAGLVVIGLAGAFARRRPAGERLAA